MSSHAPTTKQNLAQRIREGKQKRLEEQRRLQALRQAYDESRQEEQRTRSNSGPAVYLPAILILLLFVSFPLSEQIVDWYLVALFCLLNALYTVLTTEPSHWMNVSTLVLANLVLVRLSPYLYNVPTLLLALRPLPVAAYATANAILIALLYYGYVGQRFIFRSSTDLESVVGTATAVSLTSVGSGKRKSKASACLSTDVADAEQLEAFLQETERAWRIDVATSVILLFNAAALLYAGVLPREVIAQTARNVFRLLS